MLLGSTQNNNPSPDQELLTTQLLIQERYAEAYELLINRQSKTTTVLFNISLCLHWSGNYQGALAHLDLVNMEYAQISQNRKTDSNFERIKAKQNQTDDYLQGISESYLKHFPTSVQDAIIRLKTNCWLNIGDFEKVIAVANPISHKGFKDIEDALAVAKQGIAKRDV